MTGNLTLIVVDRDCANRNALARAVDEMGYIIQVDSLADLGGRWPEEAWLLVNDAGTQLADAFADLDHAGRYYPVIAFSADATISRVMDVVNCGGAGYIQWPGDAREVLSGLFSILIHGRGRAKRTANHIRAKKQLDQLTPRERQVLDGICNGLSNKEVANALSISPRTVEIHRANIFLKLRVPNLAAAVKLSLEAEYEPELVHPVQEELSFGVAGAKGYTSELAVPMMRAA